MHGFALRVAVAGALLSATALGCGRAPTAAREAGAPASQAVGETALARVGAGVVAVERFQHRLRQRQLEAVRAGAPRPAPRAVLDELLEEESLVQEALRRGVLARDEEVRERLIRSVLAQELGKLPAPAPDDLRRYYEAHRAEFPAGDRVHLRHILIKLGGGAKPAQAEAAGRRAEQVRRQVVARPAAFAELARSSSDDPSAQLGGDIGMLAVDQVAVALGPEVAAALGAVGPGEVSPVIRSARGFHVVQVVERHAQGEDPLVSLRALLASRYQNEARAAQRRKFVATVLPRSPIQVDEAQLARAAASVRVP
ncbi:MAG TPA: peptidylprolyl isomerase [Polyangia bacterium]